MNLLFDLDGTLTDPALGITRCITFALAQLGLEPPDPSQLTWCIGPPLTDSFRTLLAQGNDTKPGLTAHASLPTAPVSSERVGQAIALYRKRFAEIGMLENELIEGIPAVLAQLTASGHRLFLATSKPHVYARAILEHFELATNFIAIHGAEFDGTHSNKSDLIAHVLQTEGLSAQGTLMIGDRHHDIDGARANHLETIGVLWGYGSRAELEAASCTELAAEPAQLIECITRLGRRECAPNG